MVLQHNTKLTPSTHFFTVLFLLGLLLLSALPLLPAFAQSKDETLPDLGAPTANTGTVQPNINAQGAGFNYRDTVNGKILSVSPQYNRQNGAAIGGSLASPVGENMAAAILLMAGEARNEWLVNAGIDFNSHHRMIFSLGQLRQKLDFRFISGVEKAQVTQNNAALSYQYLLGKAWLNSAEFNAYISDTGSVNLQDKTYFTDTASLYELWSDPRRIAGGRVSGVQGRLVFTPTSNSSLKLGFGGERLSYDLLTGNDSTTRATGSAEFNQRLDYGFNLRASANAGSSQTRYALGVGKSFTDGSQLGLDVATIQGRDNTFNDSQVMLSYTQSFGGNNASAIVSNPLGPNNTALNNLDASGVPINQATADTATPNPTANSWASTLVEQVSRRPSFLPAQVVAKVDATATPTRLIAIVKTAVPVESSINHATGVITVATGTPVSGIASVTKNAEVFTNAGQFALSGNGFLVVTPSLITPPALGITDTYVVTMNNSPGPGTTIATVVVSQGYVKIDSIVITSGIITPTLSGLGLSATSVEFGAAAPTIIAPTSASSGAITYSSSTGATATITSAGVITIVGVGTTEITATQAAKDTYASTSSSITLTVTKGPLPAGALVHDGLTWTSNTAMVGISDRYAANVTDWPTANSTCAAYTGQGLPAGSWRLPTDTELLNLVSTVAYVVLERLGWEMSSFMWTSRATFYAGNAAHYIVFRLSRMLLTHRDDSVAWVTCVH